jgi:hypothetical protein
LARTPSERLVRDLLDDYDANVDPGNTKLKLSISLTCASHDKATDSVTSNVWESHAWKDERLQWTPSEYGGVDTIRIPDKLIWTPDTTQYNVLSARGERHHVNVVVKSDGSVIWIPQATYHTPCSAAADGQITCSWRIGSWTYDGNMLALESEAEPLDVTYYSANCPLLVASHTAEVVSHTYPCCEEPYPSLDISIVFKPRKLH